MRQALLILSLLLILPKGARGIAMKSIRSDGLGGQGVCSFFDLYSTQHKLTRYPLYSIILIVFRRSIDTKN